MNTKLILNGQVYAIAKKSFKDEETTYAQFLNKTENGGVEVLQVKLTDKSDIATLKEAMPVKIPVKVSQFNGKLFFTQIDTVIK